jgi:hypothetical protein
MKYFILLIGILFLAACEDKIDLSDQLNNSQPQLVVDAFINNLAEPQVIVLSGTQSFFNNSTQQLLSGAIVTLTDASNGISYGFNETTNGKFVSMAKGDSMLVSGHEYALNIKYKNETFVAYSKMNRVAPVDSLKFTASKDITGTVVPGKFRAEYFATDLPGLGDRYWIRFRRNGKLNTQAQIISISYDGSLGASTVSDGGVFILPLRQAINESGIGKEYLKGDSLMVEIYSVDNAAAFFLTSIANNSRNGTGGAFGALFSQPPYNLPTNIKNNNANGLKPVGYFSTSAVSRLASMVPLSVKRFK